MRGRKPKPTNLKILNGNPGKRSLNKKEPKPKVTPSGPYCPRWLDGYAKDEWQRLSKELKGLGLLTDIDVTAMAAYCQTYKRWREAEEKLQKLGLVYKPNAESNYLQKNPYLTIADKALDQMHKYLTEFGMTPSSRSRISVERKEGKIPSAEDILNASHN